MQFDSRLALLAVVIALSPRVVASQDPILVPQPRELQSAGPVFRVLSTTRIVLVGDLPDDRFAARSLQEELKMVAGSSPPIVPAAGDRADAIVLGRIENSTIRRLCPGCAARSSFGGGQGRSRLVLWRSDTTATYGWQ